MERGATHFTHWFQPLTGSTAEKHDSFYAPTGDGNAIAEFSGKELIQGEPDASSFPTGGIRATFEARGYTAWDPTSPAFILENPNGAHLCIPTAFASWTGEALDQKIPLLRSMDALSNSALRALRLLGDDASTRVFTTVGPEQEYFLIDERFYFERPDLITTGRTLFGAKPPKGHELDDHYFGSIPERVLACMLETEQQLARLGVPIKTRHNEVAPAQYEVAPVFENSNVGCDHQQLTMQVMQNVARRYGLVCLLHEKPFAGVNGSGKHNNWSMGTDTGANLLEPGDTPHENLQFLFFCAAVIQAVDKHQQLLRASVANAGQDHRLGANEAPPAIISVFLGAELEKIFDAIESGLGRRGDAAELPRARRVGAAAAADARRRPQPHLAVRLHRQQVRVPRARVVDVAGAPEHRAQHDRRRGGRPDGRRASRPAEADGKSLEEAVLATVKDAYSGHKRIVFSGDNYSEEWHTEAEQRGLANLAQSPDALPWLVEPTTVAVFSKYDVLSERELESRYEVSLEQYVTTVNIEGETAASIARTMLLPAAVQWYATLGAAGDSAGVGKLASEIGGADRRVRRRDLRARDRQPRPPGGGRDPRRGQVRPVDGPARDGGGARRRRQARADRAGRPLAAPEVLGDPLHQVGTHNESWVRWGPRRVRGPHRRFSEPCPPRFARSESAFRAAFVRPAISAARCCASRRRSSHWRNLPFDGCLASAITAPLLGWGDRTSVSAMPLTLEQTQTLIAAAHEKARADGLRVTVAVVDEGGLLKALARMDGAPPLSAQIAEAKAVGAALWHRDGDELAAVQESRAAFFDQVSSLVRVPIVPADGSVVVRDGDTVLGAVGVSGAKPEEDRACAEAGVAAVLD